MSLLGKKVGISLPAFQLKLPIVLQQIDDLMARGMEMIISPRPCKCFKNNTKNKTLCQHNNPQASKNLALGGENNFFSILSHLDILVIFSPPGELLKNLASKKSPLLFEEKPLVLATGPEIKGESLLLRYYSHLAQQEGIYFVPFGTVRQDQKEKETVIICSRTDLLAETCSAALEKSQIKPVIWENHFF